MAKLFLFAISCFVLAAQDDSGGGARQAAIERTKKAIQQECALASNGDWKAWHAALTPYRKALNKSFESAQLHPFISRRDSKLSIPLIPWRSDEGHLVQANSVLTVASAGDDLDAYLAGDRLTAIAAGMTKWFKARGIDLIFVPVPTKPEIYPEELVPVGGGGAKRSERSPAYAEETATDFGGRGGGRRFVSGLHASPQRGIGLPIHGGG